MIQAGYVRNIGPRTGRLRTDPVTPVAEPEVIARAGGAYGENRRPRWLMMAAILGLHVVLLFALALFDVIHVGHKRAARLTVVEIRPDEIVPPPAPPEQRRVEKPVERPIVAPPPIVQMPVPPSPVVATPIAPPPAPVVSAAPPAPPAAIVSAVAPPVSAPDGTARTLGNPAPRYPMEARRQHQQGTVRLRVVITPEGRVKEIAVARSSGFDSLDTAALETVRKWKFLPGKQAGVAVEAVGFLSIPFQLT